MTEQAQHIHAPTLVGASSWFTVYKYSLEVQRVIDAKLLRVDLRSVKQIYHYLCRWGFFVCFVRDRARMTKALL